MTCPRCNSENIVSAGFYITKFYKKRNRWRCKDCKRLFIVMPSLKNITLKQHKLIIQLSKKINPYASKYDNRKNKTYSIREIAKILDISSPTVERVLKENKN